MKARILIAGILFASCFCAEAENVYQVVTKPSGEVFPLGVIQLPATITGRVASASSNHPISFEVDSYYRSQPVAIYTNTGTGAVFRASLSIGEEGSVDISSPKTNSFDNSTPYVLVVSASTYKDGASYAVRIGTFGNFSVSFNGNGGSASQTNRVYELGRTYGSFPTATRTNHVFTGWSTAATNGVVVSTNTAVCLGYTTLYAQWKAATPSPTTPTNVTTAVTNYWVRFDANGGTGTMSNQVFTVDKGQALATNSFTRSGYDFRGWAMSAAGTVVYEDGAVVTNLFAAGATNTLAGVTNTLYASWIISSASILTQEINGVAWHYTATTNGEATIQNVSGGEYVAAVDTSIKGTLTIPGMIGSNTVVAIGERAFAGCGAVTSIEIPFGVTVIGSYAFAGCTNQFPGITIPESVNTMGSHVFADCRALKIVRYLGDCPEVDAELYAGAPAALFSGVLRVRSGWELRDSEKESDTPAEVDKVEDGDASDSDESKNLDDDDSDAVEWSASLPESWPDGDHARRVFWLTDQPLFRVVFWGVPGINNTATIQYYIPGRAINSLPDEVPERDGYTFVGWFTKPYGGVEVTENDVDEMFVNRSFSLYAHWQRDDDPASLSEVEYNYSLAHVYDGYLLDGDGNVAGIVQLKTAKARWNRKAEETNVTATASIVLLGEGTMRLKGVLDENLSGALTSSNASDERELEVSLSGSAMEGTFGSCTVIGTRYIHGKKTYLDLSKAIAANDDWKGYYVVVLKSDSGESSLGNGYVGLSVQIRPGGTGRVSGTMPDGTKVTYTGRMEVLDDHCLFPVAVPLHAGKKGGFGFLMGFSDDGVSVSAVSDWRNTSVPFTSDMTLEGAGRISRITSAAVFSLDGGFEVEDVDIDESLLPDNVDVATSSNRWQTPKADNVKFVADDAAYEVRTDHGNPSGLKLSAQPTQGTFRGSFKVFGVTDAGKSKKYTAVVNGVVLNGEGFGVATVKKVGAVPVTLKTE